MKKVKLLPLPVAALLLCTLLVACGEKKLDPIELINVSDSETTDIFGRHIISVGNVSDEVSSDAQNPDYTALKLVVKSSADHAPTLNVTSVGGVSNGCVPTNDSEYKADQWNVLYYDLGDTGAIEAWSLDTSVSDASVGYMGLFDSVDSAKVHVTVFEGEFKLSEIVIGGKSVSARTNMNYALDGAKELPEITFKATGNTNDIEVDIDSLNAKGEAKVCVKTSTQYIFSVNFTGGYVQPTELLGTLYRLQNDKELIVGYLGGSVTVGTGASDSSTTSWRAITRDWFSNTFAGVTVEERDSGWGGKGSMYASMRIDDEIIKDKCPDIVFVETAFNDTFDFLSDDDENYIYLETILNKLYMANPKVNIILVVTEGYGWTDEVESDTPVFGEQYRTIGAYYDLPVIYVGRELNLSIYAENNNSFPDDGSEWFADGVHPTDKGYAHYANTIIKYLSEKLPTDYVPNSAEYADKVLPDELYVKKNNIGELLPASYVVDPKEIENQEAIEGLEIQGKGYLNFPNKNDSVVLKFNGQNIAILPDQYASAPYGKIKYSIDGGSSKFVEMNSSGKGGMIILATDLSEGEHTITIINASSYTNVRIRKFMVWGYSEDLPKAITAVAQS